MITVPTYYASIYVSLREAYGLEIRNQDMVLDVVQRIANRGGFCATVTPTRFVYKNGSEPGVIVGLINYPRFPSSSEDLRALALSIATILRSTLKQERVSVMFPEETVMLDG